MTRGATSHHHPTGQGAAHSTPDQTHGEAWGRLSSLLRAAKTAAGCTGSAAGCPPQVPPCQRQRKDLLVEMDAPDEAPLSHHHLTNTKQEKKLFCEQPSTLPPPGITDPGPGLQTLPHQDPHRVQGKDAAFSYRCLCPSAPGSQAANLVQTYAHRHQTRRLKLQTRRQLPAGWKTKGSHCLTSERSRNPNTLQYAGAKREHWHIES